MDPRTAATVDAPDLTRAFQEGSGTSPIKIWVVFYENDVAVRATAWPNDTAPHALNEIARHLMKGDGHGVASFVTKDQPGIFESAVKQLSAGHD